MKALFLGTILGGLVAFAWSTVSWELLGWHEKPMLAFRNPEEVSTVIASHARGSGVYLLPSAGPDGAMAKEQAKAAQDALMEKMQKGPIVFAAVRTGGFGSYARGLLLQLLSLMAAALLLTWLVMQTNELPYLRRVAFLGVVGLAAGVIVSLPDWNWWGFSGLYTAVNVADFTLMWLAAGFVIAKVAKPRTA